MRAVPPPLRVVYEYCILFTLRLSPFPWGSSVNVFHSNNQWAGRMTNVFTLGMLVRWKCVSFHCCKESFNKGSNPCNKSLGEFKMLNMDIILCKIMVKMDVLNFTIYYPQTGVVTIMKMQISIGKHCLNYVYKYSRFSPHSNPSQSSDNKHSRTEIPINLLHIEPATFMRRTLHQCELYFIFPINIHDVYRALFDSICKHSAKTQESSCEFIAIQSSAMGDSEKSPGGRFSVRGAHIYYDVIIHKHFGALVAPYICCWSLCFFVFLQYYFPKSDGRLVTNPIV